MTTIDHAAEAMRCVALAGLPGHEPGFTGEALSLLGGEGTHALAEWVPMPGTPDDEYVRVRPDIAAALGIGDGDG